MGGLLKTSRWELINTLQSTSGGANLLLSRYTGLVFAFDMDDYSKYIIYGFFKNYINPGESGAAKTVVIASNGLSLGAGNNQGTQVINGGTNVRQFMIGLGG